MLLFGCAAGDLGIVSLAPWLGGYRAELDSTWEGRLELRGGVLRFVTRGGRFVQPMVELSEGPYALPGGTELTLERDLDDDTILRWDTGDGRPAIFRRTDR